MTLKPSYLALLAVLLLAGCASNHAAQQAEEIDANNNDPLEPVNRAMWDFNYDILDQYLLRPAAKGYVAVMPGFARKGLINMATNLEEPGYIVNNLLQGKVDESFVSLGRFLINSTVGLVGAVDVASKIGLERAKESFGEVLGVWDVNTGPYLMVPALGPNDARSLTGDVVDNMYYPLTLLNTNITLFRSAVMALETRANLLSQDKTIAQSLDPYAMVRDAYFQNLEYKVKDGNVEEDEDFDEGFDEDEFDDFLDATEADSAEMIPAN